MATKFELIFLLTPSVAIVDYNTKLQSQTRGYNFRPRLSELPNEKLSSKFSDNRISVLWIKKRFMKPSAGLEILFDFYTEDFVKAIFFSFERFGNF